ncbi:hypothetical protein VSH64_09075 [Amycolatopsis rhabdoformis]|uniref:Uncharacterized protein n=1 Tax=Amycolatopsis rhabdoformis TaxID=1448059 RepID=A0ABZ1IFL7_9PSEU|nr:hypothetical protein [Amycolatopsis rhabdoformis]WSE32260.1 hypothetical protein VSH64_09075 [Amycolatopsis rhabdoformis]
MNGLEYSAMLIGGFLLFALALRGIQRLLNIGHRDRTARRSARRR